MAQAVSMRALRRFSAEPRLAEELTRLERNAEESVAALESRKAARATVSLPTQSQTVARVEELTRVDTSAGSVTVLLPEPSSASIGKCFYVAKMSASNTLTLRPVSGKINNATTLSMSSAGMRIIMCDGENYWAEG